MTMFRAAEHPRRETGEFVDKPQSHPEISLVPNSDARELLGADLTANVLDADRHTRQVAAAKLLRATRYTVTTSGRSSGLNDSDIEDALSLTLVQVTDHIRARKPLTHAVLQLRAQQVVGQIVLPIRHESRKALRVLAKRVDSHEAMLGRPLSDQERVKLAVNIRENWPDPRHRPSEDFYMLPDQVPVPMDPNDIADLEGRPGAVIYSGADSDDIHLASPLADPLARKKRAGENDYSYYAEALHLPAPQKNRLASGQATRIHSHLDEMALNAALSYLRGDIDAKSESALFAPFENLGRYEREEFADALARQPHHAQRLWDSAVDAATDHREEVSAARNEKAARRLATANA
jgi:hypothetical protein